MPVPVWVALLAVAVAKKVVVFTAAKVPSQPPSRTTKVLRLFGVSSMFGSQACVGAGLWLPASVPKAAATGSLVRTRQGNVESRIRTHRLPVSGTKYLVR